LGGLGELRADVVAVAGGLGARLLPVASTPGTLLLALGEPLGVGEAARLLCGLEDGLRGRGWRVLGVGLKPGTGGTLTLYLTVALEPGWVVVIRVIGDRLEPPVRRGESRVEGEPGATEAPRPSRVVGGIRWRRGLEGWERPLVAAGIYFVDPRPEGEVFEDMARLVGREEALRIASLVWRVAYGEGYTLDKWASLVEGLRTLSPWPCIGRFQYLAGRGLRRRHTALQPKTINDKEALRAACKTLGTC
jgi:hypothetical protein